MNTCDKCDRQFKTKRGLDNHKCHIQEREDLSKTFEGIAAREYYNIWQNAKGHKKFDNDIFVNSRYFTSFVKFVKYIKTVKLTKPKEFVKFMVKNEIPPTLWSASYCYDMYMKYLRNETSAYDQAAITVDTILMLADIANDDTSNVFSILYPQEIVELITSQKLSPWILLCSNKFKERLKQIPKDEQQELINIINPTYWEIKFNENKSAVNYMKTVVKELRI